jgi:hypothetical protein
MAVIIEPSMWRVSFILWKEAYGPHLKVRAFHACPFYCYITHFTKFCTNDLLLRIYISLSAYVFLSFFYQLWTKVFWISVKMARVLGVVVLFTLVCISKLSLFHFYITLHAGRNEFYPFDQWYKDQLAHRRRFTQHIRYRNLRAINVNNTI